MHASTVFEPPYRQRDWSTIKRRQGDHDNADDAGADDDLPAAEGDETPNPDKANASKFDIAQPRRSAYSTHQPSKHANVKYQHFTALNAALYKCLQERKYGQASRIYGMLLRFSPPGIHPAGSHVDLRRQNLWGVGAEILLQRAKMNSYEETAEASKISTEEGFRDAKTFYERLILQYPFKESQASSTDRESNDDASAPNALDGSSVSALQFYPTLFSLWIFHVQGRAQERVRNFAELQETYQYEQEDVEAENEEMFAASVADIQPIVGRIGEVVRVPPYDQDAKLMQMHGESTLWLANTLDQMCGRKQDSARLKTEAAELLAKAKQLSGT